MSEKGGVFAEIQGDTPRIPRWKAAYTPKDKKAIEYFPSKNWLNRAISIKYISRIRGDTRK
ncbi:MAG: hypothetical protein ACTSU2_01195 [Promethearchaeota archaeon]